MEKEQIELQSREIAEYFKKYWTSYVDPAFDRTFSLRNWATITATIIIHFNKNNKYYSNYKKNINKKEGNDHENKLKNIFKNKKILHIGCGYGYFLEVIKNFNAIP